MAAPAATKAQHLGTTTDGRSFVRVTCEAAPVEQSDGSQWMQITPAGPFIEARDGRSFQMSDPQRVMSRCSMPMLVDWEHQSEKPFGTTRAAAWCEELVFDDGTSGKFPRPGIWGRVEWTPDGAADVKSKAFRFTSPVLDVDPETRDVQQIASVALTNRPALYMQGLTSFREQLSERFGTLTTNEPGESRMKPETLRLLCAALCLADAATDEQILEAAKTARASAADASTHKELCSKLTAQLSDLTKENGELKAKLGEAAKAAFSSERTAFFDNASREGKVPPALRAGFEAMCQTREQFEAFKTSVYPALPVIGERQTGGEIKSPSAAPGLDKELFEDMRKRGYPEELINKAAEQIKRSRAAGRERGED